MEVPPSIAQALRKASQTTGADFDYLLKTAARESAFRADAKARTSTAAGLFQFIENTWLRMIKEVGPAVGLAHYADDIAETGGGRCVVPDRAMRREILRLRNDPEIAAVMAGAFTRQNADYMAAKLGREPSHAELYIAHFLGAPDGAKLVRLAQNRPDLRADIYFPRAARANRALFYAGATPRTMAQLYELLVSKYRETAVNSPAPPAPPPAGPPVAPTLAQPQPPLRLAALAAGGPLTDAAGVGSIGSWGSLIDGPPPRSAPAPAAPAEDAAAPQQAAPELPIRRPPKPAHGPAAARPVGEAAVGPASAKPSSIATFGRDFWARFAAAR